jgi:hypothetical protein
VEAAEEVDGALPHRLRPAEEFDAVFGQTAGLVGVGGEQAGGAATRRPPSNGRFAGRGWSIHGESPDDSGPDGDDLFDSCNQSTDNDLLSPPAGPIVSPPGTSVTTPIPRHAN